MTSLKPPKLSRRDDSLIGQLVGANVLLVVLALFGASLAAGLDLEVDEQRWLFLVIALGILLTLCLNLLMLKRRFRPLERLIERIEAVDPARTARLEVAGDSAEEIDRLAQSFNRLLERIEEERRRQGRLVLRAQEDERRRLARDLHDEVNQALTAILLRLQALAEDAPVEHAAEVAALKRLVNQAMEELLALARQLRPAALDDHGLVPALQTQLKRFASHADVETRLRTEGDLETLDGDAQTAVYRVVQEALSNVARHADARSVEVRLAANGHGAELRVDDDGSGFDPAAPPAHRDDGGGLGLRGMAERARLAGGELEVRSSPGAGTTVALRVP